MSEGQAFYALCVILLAVSGWRSWRKFGCDKVTGALALAFVTSIVVGQYWQGRAAIPMIAATDGLLVMTLGSIWGQYNSMRAWTAAWLGFFKTGWSLWAVSFPYINFHSYAVALNIAFLAQIIVAGGFVDAVGHWLDDMLRRVWPRRYHLLRDGR